MASVISHHHSALGLPLGGPVLPPGVPTPVKRWNIIKGHAVVKAWLQAGAIEVLSSREDGATIYKAASVEHYDGGVNFVAEPEPVNDELTALRAEYQERVGKRAYHGWDVDMLKAKIAEASDPVEDSE